MILVSVFLPFGRLAAVSLWGMVTPFLPLTTRATSANLGSTCALILNSMSTHKQSIRYFYCPSSAV